MSYQFNEFQLRWFRLLDEDKKHQGALVNKYRSGYRCCLGHAGAACGISDEEMWGLGELAEFPHVTRMLDLIDGSTWGGESVDFAVPVESDDGDFYETFIDWNDSGRAARHSWLAQQMRAHPEWFFKGAR